MATIEQLDAHKESYYYKVEGNKMALNVRISGHEPVASKSNANDVFFTTEAISYYRAFINSAELWDKFEKFYGEDIAYEDENEEVIYYAGDGKLEEQHAVLLQRVAWMAD